MLILSEVTSRIRQELVRIFSRIVLSLKNRDGTHSRGPRPFSRSSAHLDFRQIR